jgi:two-component system nitrogen regulation response regulator GlnG
VPLIAFVRREIVRESANMRREILVVDVDPAARATIARALVGAGYHVRTTGTAATLWRWLHAREGDLDLAGATLPDEDTFKLIAYMKMLRPRLRPSS